MIFIYIAGLRIIDHFKYIQAGSDGMTGLIDLEFNTGGATGYEKNSFALIDITLMIVDENNNYRPVETYNKLVRPPRGKTILNRSIIELTSITQQQLNNGVPITEVFEKIQKMYALYKPQAVYSWGNCDEEVISWNFDHFGIEKKTGIPRKDVCIHFTDLEEVLRKKCDGIHAISQANMAVLCDYKPKNQHRAFDDVETMRQILIAFSKTDIDEMKERYASFDCYAQIKKLYSQSVNLINNAEKQDINVIDMIETAQTGIEFPSFNDAYNDKYDRNSFNWL